MRRPFSRCLVVLPARDCRERVDIHGGAQSIRETGAPPRPASPIASAEGGPHRAAGTVASGHPDGRHSSGCRRRGDGVGRWRWRRRSRWARTSGLLGGLPGVVIPASGEAAAQLAGGSYRARPGGCPARLGASAGQGAHTSGQPPRDEPARGGPAPRGRDAARAVTPTSGVPRKRWGLLSSTRRPGKDDGLEAQQAELARRQGRGSQAPQSGLPGATGAWAPAVSVA